MNDNNVACLMTSCAPLVLFSREITLFDSFMISLFCCSISLRMPAINLENLCMHYIQYMCGHVHVLYVNILGSPPILSEQWRRWGNQWPYLRYRHAECAHLRDSAAMSQINTASLIHKFCTLSKHFERTTHLANLDSVTDRPSKWIGYLCVIVIK